MEPSCAWQSERQPQDPRHENASDGSYRPLCFQGECFNGDKTGEMKAISNFYFQPLDCATLFVNKTQHKCDAQVQ